MTNNDAFAITLICVLAVRMGKEAKDEENVVKLVEGIVSILEKKGYLE